ncbi:MAG TPA: DUF5673 domain-containing protein [Candidatus Doudnabacteria bacterium]|nr:DUF5673 domain-containing protein [Candidatus Doudnabacteria bacterium]
MPRAPITVFKWEAPEFRHYPKNPAWYITMFIIIGLFVAYQVILRDWFGAVILVILGIIIYAFARQTPKYVEMQITDRGIHINGDLIPYNRIKHFWIIDDHEHKVLNLETTAYLNHLLAIELESEDAEEIREFLFDILPEHSELEPTITQKISHRFRF